MAYVAYEIKRSKETATGMRYLVRYAVISSHKDLNRGDVLSVATLEGHSNSREYLLKKYK